MNTVIVNEAKEIVRDCNILDISFRESDEKVIEESFNTFKGV